MFNVSTAAAAELLAAAARSDADGMALRIAARPMSDGSIEYGMGFDDVRVDDAPIDFGGVKVLIGLPSQMLLDDIVLDYVEVAPGEHDFVFLQPTAAASAGCGTGAAEQAPASRGGCGSGGCGSCSA